MTAPESWLTQRIVLGAGLYALLGGVVSLGGYVLDLPRLADWDNDGIAIQPNAAFCVIVSSLALLSLVAGRHRIATFCGATVLAVGGLTLLQWVSGLSFGIDSLLLFGREWGRVGVVVPGRMGPPGSFSWTLIGAALVLSAGRSRLRRWAAALALVTTAISVLSLVGYLYGADLLYALPHLTVIALQTSTFIMAVSVGIIVGHPEREPMLTLLDPGGAGLLARRALPLLLIVPLFLGWLRDRGQEAGLYDAGLGTALMSLVLSAFLGGLVWWVLNAVRVREQALRASEERFRVIADSSPTLMWRTDQTGVVFVNRHYLEFFGSAFAQVSGMGWSQFLHPDDRAAYVAAYRSAFERQVGYEYRCRFRRHDGEYRWTHTVGAPHRTPDGTFLGFVGCSTDVTDTKRAEEALADANRRKDEFLATLAHELRNPLAPVRNAVQLLHIKGRAVPELQWARDVIDRQMQQMTRLIDDLMDVSRISRGKIELKRERVALATVVQGAVETSRPLIAECGHSLTVKLPPETLYLEADLIRMAQVFSNLLNNAAKYTERGGSINLTADRQGSDIVVSVVDSGIGIPHDKLQNVFELFSQVQGALERSQGGLGIGLSLVKRLVEMHNGTIEARSDGPGTGSEFVVRLPMMAEQSSAAGRAGDEQEFPASTHRILIVDDNRDAADTLGTMLQLMGNEIRITYDGEDAVRAAGEFRPQIVLLDIGLPKLNGYEACRRIRQELWGKDMILFAVTGWGQDEDKQKARDAGFDRHMVKPVDPSSLIQLLGSLARDKPASQTTP